MALTTLRKQRNLVSKPRRLLSRLVKVLHEQMAGLPTDSILTASAIVAEAIRASRNIWVAGNGGSAATASHLAADLVGRCSRISGLPIKAMCLNDSAALTTALTNDIGWPEVYSYQLERVANKGDVFIAVSVNGGVPAEDGRDRSRNLVEAIHVGNALGCRTVGLAGNGGGAFAGLCTVAVSVDPKDPAIVEPVHSVIVHLVAELVTSMLKGSS